MKFSEESSAGNFPPRREEARITSSPSAAGPGSAPVKTAESFSEETAYVDPSALRAAQVEQLYYQASSGIYGACIAACVLVLGFWTVASHTLLIVWLACMWTIYGVRQLIIEKFLKSKISGPEALDWEKPFVVLSAISGLMWGLGGVLFFPSSSPIHLAFLIIILAGICNGVLIVYSTLKTVYLPFILMGGIPLIGRLVYEQTPILLAAGFIVAVYIAVLIVTGGRMNSAYRRFLRIRFLKDDLIDFLDQEKKRVESLYEAVKEKTAEEEKALVALRRSEQNYRELVEKASDVIFNTDSSGHFTYVNPTIPRITGWAQEELIGTHYLELIPSQFRKTVERHYGIQFVKRTPDTYFEFPIVTKDGTILWLGQFVHLSVEKDTVTGFYAIGRDITDRKRAEEGLKQAHNELEHRVEQRTAELRDTNEQLRQQIAERNQVEEALRNSEERLRAVVYGCPIPQLVIDRDKRVIFWNKALEEISGFMAEEMVGTKQHWRAFYPEERPCLAELLVDGDLEGIDRWYGEKCSKSKLSTEAYEVTEFFPAMGNEGKWLYFTVAVIRDLKGTVVGAVETLEDITDRKRAEQALRESEEKYRALFEESRDPVYISTRNGRLINANQAFLDLFGFDREEANDMDLRTIYNDPADQKRFQRDIERNVSLKDYEIKYRKKDGVSVDCLDSSSLRLDKDGTILGYQGIIRDVTHQKQLQRQLLQAQKMEAIGTLAGGIAHDFNNLLQAVLGYADLLLMKKGPEDPDRNELKGIRQAARDGADLVSRILTFSRKVESRARPIDLNIEILKAAKLLRRTLPRMIQIELDLDKDIEIIDADPAQLEQVMLNLGINAQHAMPNGGRLILETSNVAVYDEYLRAHLGAKEGKYVLLTVSDTGVGMDSKVLERVFEPFFTTKPDGLGTGLGLSMVHGIVTQLGGYIRCYSEPGSGASFKIYFPVSDEGLTTDSARTGEMPAFGTETILLVDDDARIREMGSQMIKTGGYKVLVAARGEEALKIYSSNKDEIALIVLDIIMPGMGGSQCLEELLRIDPDVRVLVASGYSKNSLKHEQKGRGARGFISKPYDRKDILTAIRKVLDEGHL